MSTTLKKAKGEDTSILECKMEEVFILRKGNSKFVLSCLCLVPSSQVIMEGLKVCVTNFVVVSGYTCFYLFRLLSKLLGCYDKLKLQLNQDDTLGRE